MIQVLPVIVGIDHWRDITSPFLDSIRQHYPTAPLVCVDNHSRDIYPAQDDVIMLRTNAILGYNQAMNYAVEMSPTPEWYVFFNNDCLCQGKFMDTVSELDPHVFYGSGDNCDGFANFMFQWSAWMVVSRKMWEAVGEFDPKLSAGFEDFDYQLRAYKAGYKLAWADLPVQHMDKHTRKEVPYYQEKWRDSRKHFASKHNWFIPELNDPRASPC